MFFRQYQIKGIEDIVDVFLSDNQWRLEGHDIAANAVFANDEAAVLEDLEAIIQDFRSFTAVGMDELGTIHEPETPDITDDGMFLLQLAQACPQLLAPFLCIFGQCMFLNIVEYSKTCG